MFIKPETDLSLSSHSPSGDEESVAESDGMFQNIKHAIEHTEQSRRALFWHQNCVTSLRAKKVGQRGTHKQMEVEQSPDPENDPQATSRTKAKGGGGGWNEGFYCDALPAIK